MNNTRIVLHCVANYSEEVVVHACRNAELWLIIGTAKKRQFIPIRDNVDHMPFNNDASKFILSCHGDQLAVKLKLYHILQDTTRPKKSYSVKKHKFNYNTRIVVE